MTHYIAIVEDAGPDCAIGVCFPDLKGCFSAGDTLDEAMKNAPEALALWMEGRSEDEVPAPRTLSQLNADPETARQLQQNHSYMVALVPYEPSAFRPAAE